MNGNELNNMAQRYKDEMMRLYKKSGASDNAVGTAGSQSFSAPQERQQTQAQQNPPSMQTFPAQNSYQASHSQPCPSSQSGTRDMSGTPVPNVPNASFFGSANQNSQGTVNIPVSCECRFPTAESIINSIAQTPVTLPITPEDTCECASLRYISMSSRSAPLRELSPLRTVRESFPSYGSSNSKLLFVTKSRLIVTSIYFC